MIQVENLIKQYRQAIKKPGLLGSIQHLISGAYIDKTAVNNISFTIQEGESVAYLGKNGAGKSTTIKMLTGVLRPTSGTIHINGQSPFKNRIDFTKNIGVVFGQRTQLWWDIPIRESFRLLKDIYEVSDQIYTKNMSNFSDILGLEDLMHLTARNLSLGQRMRADIAAALLHNPKILFLDEPTLGLDVIAKEKIREFIRFTNKEKKTTVILTTHDLEDIEQICDRLILIDQGSILFDGNLQLMIDRYTETKKIHFIVKNIIPNGVRKFSFPGARILVQEGAELVVEFNRFRCTAGEIVSEIMKIATVQDIRIEEPNIESILKLIYEGDNSYKIAGNIGEHSL